MKMCLLSVLLCAMLLCGCAGEKQTPAGKPTDSPTTPVAQTQPDSSLLPSQPQSGGPLFLPELPTIPPLPDTVPPIVVPTVPVYPNPEPEKQ